jgi:hypothetical protein
MRSRTAADARRQAGLHGAGIFAAEKADEKDDDLRASSVCTPPMPPTALHCHRATATESSTRVWPRSTSLRATPSDGG